MLEDGIVGSEQGNSELMLDEIEEGEVLEESGEIFSGQEMQMGQMVSELQDNLEEAPQQLTPP